MANSAFTPLGLAAVNSVSNADGTLTISPTSGAVVASINLANANTWTKTQTITATNSSTTALVALGVSSQSATLFDAQITGGTPVFSLDKHGRPIALADGTTTIAAGAGAGTLPSVVTVTGNDVCGIINITTGSSPTANNTIATITFANAYGSAPKAVIVAPATSGSNAAGKWYVGATTASTWKLENGTSALAATTAFAWYYFVIG